MTRLVQRLGAALGLEVRRKQADTPLSWVTDVDQITDDVSESWRTAALHLRNRNHRPPRFGRWVGGDLRVDYVAWFLDVRGARVLELGPLEGFYSVLLDKLGARETVALEARQGNLAKCTHVKELYGLEHTEFLRHDLEALARGVEQPTFEGPFDLVFSLGVLYHLRDPVRALDWAAEQAPALFLGTSYVERDDERWYEERGFSEYELESEGERYQGKRFVESPSSPLGGLSDYSIWLDEASLVRALHHAGYDSVSVLGKDLFAEFPHIVLLAERATS